MKYFLCLIFFLNLCSLQCYVFRLNSPKTSDKTPRMEAGGEPSYSDTGIPAETSYERPDNQPEPYEEKLDDDSDDYPEYIDELTDPDPDKDEIIVKTIKQPVDHFQPCKGRNWQMKFMQNDKFFTNSSPIYVMVGGAGPLKEHYLKEGLMYELAKETNGTMFATEHRYYGDNITHEDLLYLHSRQALRDLKELLNDIRRLPGCEDSSVVLIGEDYAGNLATWVKVLYPNLVNIVIASSAPLLATSDFTAYLIHAKRSFIKGVSYNCVDNIEKVFNYFLNCLKDGKYGEFVTNANVCQDVDMTEEVNQQTFFFIEMFLLMSTVEGGVDKMKKSCAQFELNYKHILENKVKNHRRSIFWYKNDSRTDWRTDSNNETCNNYDFDHFIEGIRNSEDTRNKHWLYQCCNEFGFFPTTSDQFLGLDVLPQEFYNKVCSTLFGAQFNENALNYKVAETNQYYHGLDLNTRRVVFVHGELDPWKHLGITKQKNNEMPVVIIKGESHSKDLFADTDTDSGSLREARAYVKKTVKKWLYDLAVFTDNEDLKKRLNESLFVANNTTNIR